MAGGLVCDNLFPFEGLNERSSFLSLFQCAELGKLLENHRKFKKM
jgi:hypothetical protein